MKSKKLWALVAVVAIGMLVAGTWLVLKPKKIVAPTEQSTQASVQNPQTGSDDTTQQPPAFNKQLYSLDDPLSPWVVANKQRPLNPVSYAPNDLVSVGGGRFLRQEAATALREMKQASANQGLILNPLSGYRSYQTQQAVYAREVSTYGQTVADTQSARPGHSEHQTGWAIDVGGGGCGIEDCFGQTSEGQWVAANAHLFGFIVRYQPGKESITGYRAEPWHLRYVGKELAAELYKTSQTLEEFFSLSPAPNY